MNHTNSPPVRNMAAYLAPSPSGHPLQQQPAQYEESSSHEANYVQYYAPSQAAPEAYHAPYLPPKPAEYVITTIPNPQTSSSSLSTPVPAVSSSTLPTASVDRLDIAKFEDWDKPVLSLFRFRARVLQFILVLILFCVNISTEVEYLDHDIPEVFNIARQLGITPESGRQHFFTFVTFFAFLVCFFNFLAIALVRCVHPQKPPKSRIIGEIATDALSTLFLTIGSTLLLNPGAISNPSMFVSRDLRNVACVISSEQDFDDITDNNAHFVNYPSICMKSWVSVVFGYLTLATFALTIAGGIHRARKLKLFMDASYPKGSGQV